MRYRLCLILLTQPLFCLSDGLVVDKVYDPYVQLLETEIEYRAIAVHDNVDGLDGQIVHRLGVGRALNDRWAGEIYLIGSEDENSGLQLTAYELEAKWQLTEQGEFDNDYGILFELERERVDSIWEVSSTLIIVRELGKWVNTANVSLIYERSGGLNNEIETALSLQSRYRYSSALEPALEFYSGQDARGIGPLLTGMQRLGLQNQLRWEAGAIFGLGSDSPDLSIKLLLEYEFY
ncbi:Uncharacterised protein [Zhongshania aliphaticivorans]|uniref:Copper resistance protein B n=1 Tax=Zhongshania aliphaticivorans TaxID=1470434 RepID=A0A5S9N0I4_9GAMM|nr:hypothetical protein [Zhongshania aliphaticivorans]CAA0082258.1 Uncharacterised protein [Zhongshania aliphaticivorans]CAA0084351.1 Uncharacterised protein [Zhongshania aliphaticivorans]